MQFQTALKPAWVIWINLATFFSGSFRSDPLYLASLAPDRKGLVTRNSNITICITHYVTFNHGKCLVQQRLSTVKGLQYKKKKRIMQGEFQSCEKNIEQLLEFESDWMDKAFSILIGHRNSQVLVLRVTRPLQSGPRLGLTMDTMV